MFHGKAKGCLQLPELKHFQGKVVFFHVMKAYGGSKGSAPLILNLGIR
jgi:hypothetical protein